MRRQLAAGNELVVSLDGKVLLVALVIALLAYAYVKIVRR